MIRSIYVVAAVAWSIGALAAGSGADGASSRPASLRFMTFNIWGDYFNNPVAERMDNLAKSIKTRRPDIVAFQEVTSRWWKSGLFEDLAKEGYGVVTGDMKAAWKRAGGNVRKTGGNFEPLLYRKDVLDVVDSGCEIFDLKRTNTKMLTYAVFKRKADGRLFIAFSTHLWWKHNSRDDDAERESEVRRIVNRVAALRDRLGGVPAIGGGDLNCNIKSVAYRIFVENGFRDSDKTAHERIRHRSHHADPKRGGDGAWHGKACSGRADNPDKSIDRVLFTDKIVPLRHEVGVEQFELDVSDHSPIIVDFELGKANVDSPL